MPLEGDRFEDFLFVRLFFEEIVGPPIIIMMVKMKEREMLNAIITPLYNVFSYKYYISLFFFDWFETL